MLYSVLNFGAILALFIIQKQLLSIIFQKILHIILQTSDSQHIICPAIFSKNIQMSFYITNLQFNTSKNNNE